MRMYDRSSLFRIVLQVRDGFRVETVEAQCAALLEERHGEEDFTITTPDAILESLDSILTALTLALAGIASISLGVAGIGIMNVMLVSVSERTGEIGLFKAIGASPRQLLSVFLAEAATLSAVGGGLGLLAGAGLLKGSVLLYPQVPLAAPAWAVAAAFGVSLGVGVTFGVWPAAKAARLDPVAALAGRQA